MGRIIEGKSGKWEIVIGLEVHAQIHSASKLFSRSATAFGAEPNAQVSFIDAAMPGMLPLLNAYAVEQAVKTGIALQGTINHFSQFDRKNYFYADLPQGYQITQFYHPIMEKGVLHIHVENEAPRAITITRLHMEQDAGKSIHDISATESCIDLNRAGIALMEIVSEPELRSSEEAASYVKKLRSILRYIGSCDGNMEEGSLRCDANVSVRLLGTTTLGTRREIKNLNSMRYLMQAINYEAENQVHLLESGTPVLQETCLFDPTTQTTRTMRTKEEANDYRYFPCPDLPPLVLEESYVTHLASTLPELPDTKRKRYEEEYGLSFYDAELLTSEKAIASYFEIVACNNDAKLASNWITGELFSRLNKHTLPIEESRISASNLGILITRIKDNVISGKMAKSIFDIAWDTGKNVDQIIKEEGFVQMVDAQEIESLILSVLQEHEEKAHAFREGKEKLFGFFVGEIMKKSKGKANPALVNDILTRLLKGH